MLASKHSVSVRLLRRLPPQLLLGFKGCLLLRFPLLVSLRLLLHLPPQRLLGFKACLLLRLPLLGLFLFRGVQSRNVRCLGLLLLDFPSLGQMVP